MDPLSELRRSTTDGKVAGVCVMLADRWRIDPLLVRLAAILLALSSGIGLVLYAALWLTVPPAGSDRAPIDSVLPSARRLGLTVWVVALVVACITTAALLHHLVPFGVGPAVVMAAVWYFGWYRPRQRRALSAADPVPTLGSRPFAEPTAFTEAAAAWQARVQHYQQTQERTTLAPSEPPTLAQTDPGYSPDAFLAHPDPVGLYAAPTPPRTGATVPASPAGPTRRRTGRLQLIGWTLTLVALGVLGWLDRAYELPFFAYPAAALLAVGLTFIVGTWLPRPRGLFPVALLLTVVTALGAMSPGLPQGEHLSMSYSAVSELPRGPVTNEFGSLEADLSRLRLDTDVTYAANVELGRLTVVVPPEANVRVEWNVNAGQVDILDLHRETGVELAAATTSPGTNSSGPTLTIRAGVEMGRLEVRR
jgi:phage shock protein PspC (stress-responsive transcriptional regulator)